MTRFFKMGKLVAMLAMLVATLSSTSLCMFFFHQPEVPAKLRQDNLDD